MAGTCNNPGIATNRLPNARKKMFTSGPQAQTLERLAEVAREDRRLERELLACQGELRDERERLNHELIDDTENAKAMAAFDPLWETLNFRGQARLLQLLIERIEYDGREGTISITFLPSGIRALANREFSGDAA